MRALVTGGAGFIGSHIVEALLARGDQVSILDNLDPRVHSEQFPTFPQRVRFVHGDILSRTAIQEAIVDGVDAVFHEAAMVGLGKGAADAESYASVNVIGTIRLMDAIAQQPYRHPRFILASTMALYGEGAYECKLCGKSREGRRKTEDLEKQNWEPHCVDCGAELEPLPVTEDQPYRPSSIYANTKLNQELICISLGKDYGIPVVALRYHNVYGPRMPRDTPYAGVASIFKSRLLAGRCPIIYEDGGQLRDFIHVEDITQANLLVADAPEVDVAFEAFNVGTGRPHQILDFALELAKCLAPGLKPEFPGLYRPGDVRHIFASISKIQRLGFSPHISFEEGVAKFASEPARASARGIPS